MDIGHVNNLLSEVKQRLEYLDPTNEGVGELDMQQADVEDGENRSARLSAAEKRLSHLLAKLGANRSDSNRVKAYGTK